MNAIRLNAARALLVSVVLLPASAFANTTAGGALIHSAVTLDFDGGSVTASVDVTVMTIASAPVLEVDPATQEVFAGDSVSLAYTLTSSSNGFDTYNLVISSTDTEVPAPDNLAVDPQSLGLGASITSADSEPDTLFIPAGSEEGLGSGDVIVLEVAGSSHAYEINDVIAGTPASTSGSTTTAETPTELVVSAIEGAPDIGTGTVPAGTQLGERADTTVSLEAGTPTTPGTDGAHVLLLSGTTEAVNSSGSPVSFDDDLDATVTVLSGEAILTKEVRNFTENGAFATSGVVAQSGDELEYRITAEAAEGETVTGAELTDSIAQYSTYIEDSTTLNGDAVADSTTGDPFPLADGLEVNSPGGDPGQILDEDGEEAVVIYRVTVD